MYSNQIAMGGSKMTIIALLACVLISACGTDGDNDVTPDSPPVDPPVEDDPIVNVGPAGSAEPFCLELTSARDRVLLGEPLTLIVSLRNCSDQAQEVRDLLGPEYGLLSVLIGNPQRAEQPYNPLVRRDGRGKGYVELAAGESLSATVPVYFGRDGWQLNEPGAYTFMAEYFIDELELSSNLVEVYIDSPDTTDLPAARMLMDSGAATFYFLGGGDEKGAAALRAVVEQLPGSPWASYASLGLAIDAAGDNGNASGEQACQALEAKLRAIEQDWIIALRGFESLADCLRESGQESELQRVTDDFVGRHPGARTTLHARGG